MRINARKCWKASGRFSYANEGLINIHVTGGGDFSWHFFLGFFAISGGFSPHPFIGIWHQLHAPGLI